MYWARVIAFQYGSDLQASSCDRRSEKKIEGRETYQGHSRGCLNVCRVCILVVHFQTTCASDWALWRYSYLELLSLFIVIRGSDWLVKLDSNSPLKWVRVISLQSGGVLLLKLILKCQRHIFRGFLPSPALRVWEQRSAQTLWTILLIGVRRCPNFQLGTVFKSCLGQSLAAPHLE